MGLGSWSGQFGDGLLGTLCGVIALACVVAWPYATTYRKAIMLQSVGAASFAVQFACLGAWTATAASSLSLVQLLCAASTGNRPVIRAVCGASFAVLIVITIATWQGVPSLFAMCGSIAGSAARLQRSTTRMKIVFLLGAPFWVLHNMAVGAVFALCVDAVSIAGNGFSLVRTARRREGALFDLIRLTHRAFAMPPAVDVDFFRMKLASA